jgi:hypothetical protein
MNRPKITLSCLLLLLPVLLGFSDIEIANAIKKAEGIHSRFPYGILVKYKNTTPRQACLNTIAHARRDWNGQGDFISFLGSRYCPTTGKLNKDEMRLNKNWIFNVHYFLRKETQNGQKTGASVQEMAQKKG